MIRSLKKKKTRRKKNEREKMSIFVYVDVREQDGTGEVQFLFVTGEYNDQRFNRPPAPEIIGRDSSA